VKGVTTFSEKTGKMKIQVRQAGVKGPTMNGKIPEEEEPKRNVWSKEEAGYTPKRMEVHQAGPVNK